MREPPDGGSRTLRPQGKSPCIDRILTSLARGALLLLVALASALALAAPAAAAPSGRVLVAEFENDVNPVTQDYLLDAIEQAEEGGYAAVVIEMDTPGGLGSSMRAIVKAILAAKVPVVVYVAPPGASADSAGRGDRHGRRRARDGAADEHRLLDPDLGRRRGHLGRPAPQGRQRRGRLHRRARREHGRNVAVAREMVTKATNLGAREALEQNVIDVIATDYADLFRQIDGDDVGAEGPDDHDAAGTEVERIEMSTWKRILDILIDPNIIALMLSIGLIGIVVELWNPGLIFPGTVGAISLIVGLYGLQVLPVSAAGLLLMILAAAFFVAEAFIVSHGALSVAGAVMFVIGALLLFDPAGEAYQVSLPVALAIAGTLMLLFGFALTKAAQARRMPAIGRRAPAGRRDGAGARRATSSSSTASSGRRARADGSPLEPGERGRRRGGRPGRAPPDRRISGTRSRKDVIR